MKTFPEGIKWIPTNSLTYMTDPGSRKTEGYNTLSAPPAKEHNFIFNMEGQCQAYSKAAHGGQYYVDIDAGADSNVYGSASDPWVSLDKALSEIPNVGATTINLVPSATTAVYTVNADATITNAKVTITGDPVYWSVYSDTASATDKLRTMSLEDSSLIITDGLVVRDISSVSAVFTDGCNGILTAGNCSITINEVTFEDTNTPASTAMYTFIQPYYGDLNLSFGGIITNNDYGYVVGYSPISKMSIVTTGIQVINSEEYMLRDGVYQNDLLRIEFLNSSADIVTAGATSGTFQIGFAHGTATLTAPIDFDAPSEDVISAISSLTKFDITALSATVTHVGASTAISTMTIELYGSVQGESPPELDYVSAAGLTGGDYSKYRWWYKKRATPGPINVLTNIDGI